MKKKFTLIVVDCQNDFCSPTGKLFVKGADRIYLSITEFIRRNLDTIENIIFTVDWHPQDHCSFEDNGGQWPPHCVQYSWGAAIDSDIFDYVRREKINYIVRTKGENREKEEYGAFSKYFDQLRLIDEYEDNFVICGVAGDYCVLETLKNIKEMTDNVKVFLAGVASIDNGEKLKKFMDENKIEGVE